ncbi:hypothetical protein JCM1840_003511 [Sporobolomyces johnsonii]
MSNSDKFDQDAAIVPDDPSVNAEGGVLGGGDEELQGDNINAPSDGNYESVSDNKISQGEFENDEFDGVKESNIIEGERSTRGKNFAQADEEADRAVDAVLEANVGQSDM